MAVAACVMQRCAPETVEQWMREMEEGGEGEGRVAVQLRRKLRIKLTQKAMCLSAQRKQRPPQ